MAKPRKPRQRSEGASAPAEAKAAVAKPRKPRRRPEGVSAPVEVGTVMTEKAAPQIEPASEVMSLEEVARILQARAQTLAQVPPTAGEGATAQVVLFTLGEEVYGIEAVYVENIYPLEGLTPVPCTPDFVAGVVNLRGRIFSVVDLRRFMGLPGITIDESTLVIATSVAGLEVCLLANNVLSVGPMALDQLGPALPTATHIAAEYTRGVTSDLAVLLNLEALMHDRRMIVHEEV